MNQYQNPNTYRNQMYRNSQGRSQAPGGQEPQKEPEPSHNQSLPPRQDWMDNPALAGIDPSKLQMLSAFASQAQGKNQNELLSILMAAASQANSNNMSFQPDETEAIINVMKIGKSPQEIQRIDRICALMRQFRR